MLDQMSAKRIERMNIVASYLALSGGRDRDLSFSEVIEAIEEAGYAKPMRTLNEFLKWNNVIAFVGSHRQDQRYRVHPEWPVVIKSSALDIATATVREIKDAIAAARLDAEECLEGYVFPGMPLQLSLDREKFDDFVAREWKGSKKEIVALMDAFNADRVWIEGRLDTAENPRARFDGDYEPGEYFAVEIVRNGARDT